MILPSDFYKSCDSVAKSLSEVKANIDKIAQHAADKGYRVFWRGQANHEWGLVSSLMRRLGAVDDKTLNKVEDKILNEAGDWVSELGQVPYTEPLAKLAYLQHHGVPTRLLDFTSEAWMAVFFAVEGDDEVDGRLFAILVDQASVLPAPPAGTPWRSFGTNEVRVFDPIAAGLNFPRLQAQSGVLVVGRLPSTRPHRKGYDRLLEAERSLLAEEVRRILSVPFKLSRFDPAGPANGVPNGASTPIGLTFRIHVDKESVRRDLAGVGRGNRTSPAATKITHRSVYPDAAGMLSHSKVLRGLDKGVLLI